MKRILLPVLIAAMAVGCSKSDKPNGSRNITVEGKTYKVVSFNGNDWMTSNLDVETLNEGTAIPQVQDEKEWAMTDTPAWCYADVAAPSKYGKLYNLAAVKSGKLAPKGFHVAGTVKDEFLMGLFDEIKTGDSNPEKAFSTQYSNTNGFALLKGGWRSVDKKTSATDAQMSDLDTKKDAYFGAKSTEMKAKDSKSAADAAKTAVDAAKTAAADAKTKAADAKTKADSAATAAAAIADAATAATARTAAAAAAAAATTAAAAAADAKTKADSAATAAADAKTKADSAATAVAAAKTAIDGATTTAPTGTVVADAATAAGAADTAVDTAKNAVDAIDAAATVSAATAAATSASGAITAAKTAYETAFDLVYTVVTDKGGANTAFFYGNGDSVYIIKGTKVTANKMGDNFKKYGMYVRCVKDKSTTTTK